MILVVGDVMTDVIVRPDGPLAHGTDRRATIVRRPGGSGANIACWLAHLGTAVRFAGRVAAVDHAAETALLRSYGVEPHLAADPDVATGSVVAILSPDGQRSFLTDRGANAGLCAADLPVALLDGVALLHVSGHAFFEPAARAAVMGLMRSASGRIPVSLDAGSAGWLAAHGRAAWRGWTRDAALCFANTDEAAIIGVERGAYEYLVVTRGAEGAEVQSASGRVSLPATMATACDTTGAGDGFVAGFLCCWQAAADAQAALRAGLGVAAQAISVSGGRPPRCVRRPSPAN